MNTETLFCDNTIIGRVAVVHLSKVGSKYSGALNSHLVKDEYGPLFKTTDVVLGDLNTTWQLMTDSTKGCWGNAVVNSSHATRRSTYLPGHTDTKPAAYWPPAFNLVVARRPLSVTLLKQQVGPNLQRTKLPRKLIASHNWCSDHVPVIAVVRHPTTGAEVTVATFNVADPLYFGHFFPEAAHGFNHWENEKARLLAAFGIIKQLLGAADIVGLQEVPWRLVLGVTKLGVKQGFLVQWVSAPCTPIHDDLAGISGSYTEDDEGPMRIPKVPHLVLLVKTSVIVP